MSVTAHEQVMPRAPLSLAEFLDLRESAEAVWGALSLRTAAGQLRSAWLHTEYAVNRSKEMSDFERVHSILTARELTSIIMSEPRAHADTAVEALTLASYLGVFQKRALSQEVTRDDCQQLYGSLAAVFTHLRPLTPGRIPPATCTQLMTLALSARSRVPEYLLYPASPREECSPAGELNHDAYFICGDEKAPIQQKLLPTERQYNESVGMMVLLPLIRRANAKCGFDTAELPAEQVNHVISLVVAECSGEPLDKAEKQLLDTVTEAVIAHYRRPTAITELGAEAA